MISNQQQKHGQHSAYLNSVNNKFKFVAKILRIMRKKICHCRKFCEFSQQIVNFSAIFKAMWAFQNLHHLDSSTT